MVKQHTNSLDIRQCSQKVQNIGNLQNVQHSYPENKHLLLHYKNWDSCSWHILLVQRLPWIQFTKRCLTGWNKLWPCSVAHSGCTATVTACGGVVLEPSVHPVCVIARLWDWKNGWIKNSKLGKITTTRLDCHHLLIFFFFTASSWQHHDYFTWPSFINHCKII